MKTPEEIKKGLECCTAECDACGECPYPLTYSCQTNLKRDALAYIQQLEADNASKDERTQMLEVGMEQWHDVAASPGAVEDMARENYRLTQELEAVKRERDAAVRELPHSCWNCKNHLKNPIEETDDCGRTIHIYCDADCCFPDEENSRWEWRGVCKENTEVQE